ncbi:hypothetical protein CEP54_009264 [Fusarium duplospermum]|uniref:Uncharacterized protein n=1 Tax=Fusarium duplospermum TaxID=1325734 RepID=A0A428PRH3_9HYPO|nr:hypothetical protein CEP54_009264 [Fusarium duplospermum]
MSSRRTSSRPHGLAPIEEEPIPAPVLVRELKPVGVVSADGRMLALRFQNPSGGPQTNVMAYTKDIAPGAMIYQGSTDGFEYVREIVCLVGNTDTVAGFVLPIHAPVILDGVLSSGQRLVRLSLQDRGATAPDSRPSCLAPTSRSEVALIVWPVNPRLSGGSLPPGCTRTRLNLTLAEETEDSKSVVCS